MPRSKGSIGKLTALVVKEPGTGNQFVPSPSACASNSQPQVIGRPGHLHRVIQIRHGETGSGRRAAASGAVGRL